jgi:hypothetical protein
VNFIQKKLWIACSKFRFFRLPVEKRVRLEVEQDGRHLTFLLVSLYEAGHGVQVFGSQFVFRELMLLRKTAPIPFLYGGKETECGISISDKSGFNHRGHNRAPGQVRDGATKVWPEGRASGSDRVKEHGGGKRVLLDYDFFSGLNKGGASHGGTANTEVGEDRGKNSSSPATSHSPLVTAPEALRMPYFMHPSIYHRGLHKRRSPSTALDSRLSTLDSAAKQRRRFRIGFFGTHDREFYTKHYHFPGMNRFEILEVFLQKFGQRMTRLRGFPRDYEPCEIAVSIDGRGGDRQGKSFLPQEHYFAALRECDFVLSPPGICTPLSHNLIEAMFCGAIPITNAGSFMAEPLKDGETYVEFHDAEGLVSVIERALAMDSGEVSRMQEAVRDYYERFLEPEAFVENAIRSNSTRILVNAEENSVPLFCKEFQWTPDLK